MAKDNRHSNNSFCNDSQLLYNDYETEFINGEGLLFDESYRLAHLPLVAPNHPRVIQTKSGTNYNAGTHEPVYSIVIPIYTEQLHSSAEFLKLYKELRASKISHKISWETFSERKSKLHATICGAISTEDPPAIEDKVFTKLREIGPVSFRIRGLFSGNINIGRLYLKVYPEQRAGTNMFHVLQQIFGTPITHLYVVGLFNFIDELDHEEARELEMLLNVWRDIEFLEMEIEELWILKSRDDLVLNGNVVQTIPIA